MENKMPKESTVLRLKEILRNELLIDLESEEINENDGLQSTIGLDSVAFIELRVCCERDFSIEITDREFSPENFRCLASLAALIESLCSTGID